ncbi:MAG: Autotransporter beta-domain protein [Alphaproteobacteria bacterium ADurb.Bin438]|nr:MAG: Autotransporter beta-domain protein [Alphaproteobacteria bacterium ADurb.Bin438]
MDTFGVAAKSSYEGWNMDFNVDGAYNLFTTNNGLKFKVISGAEVLYSYTNGFTENGAGGLSLDVKSMNETSTNAKVGFGVEKVTKDYGISTNVYYKRLISGYDSDMEARFTGGTTYFKVKGYDFEENMGGAEVSYEYNVTPRSTVYFDVVGEGSRDVMSVAGTAGVRYKF